MARNRPLLDFGAGLLIGLSITVALFAAMEESDGRLSHDMLLIAVAALVTAIILKFAARPGARHRSVPHPHHPSAVDTGWTVKQPSDSVPKSHAPDSSSKNYGALRRSGAVPEQNALHHDAQGSAAEGDTRRL